MRLVCPNCGAQYEVDASVIPASGRDVQCSACGHGWFVASPDAPAAEATEPQGDWSFAEEPGTEPEPWQEAAEAEADGGQEPQEPPAPEIPSEEPVEPVPELPGPAPAEAPIEAPDETPPELPEEFPGESPEEVPADMPAEMPADLAVDPGLAAASDAGDAVDPEATAPPSPELRRKTLDDAVMAILREEAEREAQARLNEGSMESRHDLGLVASVAGAAAATAGAAAGAAAGERSASLRDTADAPDQEDLHASHRRGVLPDIEEINSTLRATSERGDEAAARDAPETLRRKRSGFRVGFTLAFLAALALLALYLMAPALVGWMPSLEPALAAYVAAVDHGRLWLDGLLRSSTEAMRPAAPGN